MPAIDAPAPLRDLLASPACREALARWIDRHVSERACGWSTALRTTVPEATADGPLVTGRFEQLLFDGSSPEHCFPGTSLPRRFCLLGGRFCMRWPDTAALQALAAPDDVDVIDLADDTVPWSSEHITPQVLAEVFDRQDGYRAVGKRLLDAFGARARARLADFPPPLRFHVARALGEAERWQRADRRAPAATGRARAHRADAAEPPGAGASSPDRPPVWIVGDHFVIEAGVGGLLIGELPHVDLARYVVRRRLSQATFDELLEAFYREHGHYPEC